MRSPAPHGMVSAMSRAKEKREYNVCFTVFDWTPEILERVLSLPPPARHVIAGEETCPMTGRRHLQCAAHLKEGKSFSAMKAWILQHTGLSPHFEECLGTYETNIAYCSKGEQPKDEWHRKSDGGIRGPNYGKNARVHQRGHYTTKREQGENQKQAAKRNLEAAYEGRWDDVDADVIAYRLKTFQGGLRFFRELRDGPVKRLSGNACDYFEWHYGVPGSGKSTFASSITPAFFHPLTDSWDGYTDGDTVVLADLDESHAYLLRNIKIWCDLDPFQAKVLYDRPTIRPRRIIVTSNCSIEELFARCKPEHVKAVRRRFRVFHWSEPFFLDEEAKIRNPAWEPPPGVQLPEAMLEDEIDEPGPEWTRCANWAPDSPSIFDV